LCGCAQMAIFGDFLHPVFPASGVQHVSDLHSKFALRSQLRIGEENDRRKGVRKKKTQDKDIMSASATLGGHNQAHVYCGQTVAHLSYC